MSAEIFVPGRLCLFGEHSDWAAAYQLTHPEIAAGACLVAGTDQGLYATAEPIHGSLELSTVLPHGEEIGPARISADLDALGAAAKDADFFSYICGVAAEVNADYGVGGLRLQVRSDLPVRKGLSSSAAISVLAARAFSEAYGLGLDLRAQMDLAYRGERRTGSECGRMDQICAYGRRVTRLDFAGQALSVEQVNPGGTFHFLIADLRRGKDTRRILADLNACYPDREGAVAERVRAALGTDNLNRVEAAQGALVQGDAERLGALMVEAQEAFDRGVAPACDELRSPRLHEVMELEFVSELAYGIKGVGSQGDGCAQLLAASQEARVELTRLLEADGLGVYPLTIEPTPSPGASTDVA